MNQEKADHIENWLYRAREDISVVKSLSDSGIEFYTSTICFHAQQAVEKFLKAFLIFHDVDLKSLTEFGVSVRYPDDFFIPGVNETKEYIDITNGISEIVESLIQIR